jgi:hypothetical protein
VIENTPQIYALLSVKNASLNLEEEKESKYLHGAKLGLSIISLISGLFTIPLDSSIIFESLSTCDE